jgi:single stranded DNA-binding protein
MKNTVTLIGNLGANPELRYTTESGKAVCNFSIATNRSWTDKNTGEKKQLTEWHRIVVFGKRAEACAKHLKKGRLVDITGRLKSRKWKGEVTVTVTDDAGNESQVTGLADRYATEIVADNVIFLPSSSSRRDENAPPAEDDIPEAFAEAG